MKLQEFSVFRGIIRCDTGLRVGGSKDSLEIGTKDNPIIRHPVSGLPYIPGSSLKGKMRSLFEQTMDYPDKSYGKPCECSTCEVCKLFGCGSPKKSNQPTRLIFRDAPITKDSEACLREAQEEKGINFSEIKYETRIDRNKGKAADGSLHNNERVPEGTTFSFELSVRIFEGDNKDGFKQKIVEGLRLIQQDYLGSSGSRGYGKVTFLDLTFDDQPFTL